MTRTMFHVEWRAKPEDAWEPATWYGILCELGSEADAQLCIEKLIKDASAAHYGDFSIVRVTTTRERLG